MKTGLLLQVTSTFSCSSIEPSLVQAVVDAGIADGVVVAATDVTGEYMLAPSSPQILGTIVLLRAEDWLREELTSSENDVFSDALARQGLRVATDGFINNISTLSHRGKQVWFMPCPSTGWISERHKLVALCRTYTNLVAARVRNLPKVTSLTSPGFLASGEFDDRNADRTEHKPYTQEGFDKLGQFVGVQLARTFAHRDLSAVPASSGSPELAKYLAGLRVRVEIVPADLSQRTHVDRILRTAASFSLTGEKPLISEVEVNALIASKKCMLISVADRLSDYGPSGLVAFRSTDDALIVEAMALSCTVLGKQVEHAVLSALAQIAAERSFDKVVFEYIPSGRNQPMLTFLQATTDGDLDTRYILPTDQAEDRIKASAVNPEAWSVIYPSGHDHAGLANSSRRSCGLLLGSRSNIPVRECDFRVDSLRLVRSKRP